MVARYSKLAGVGAALKVARQEMLTRCGTAVCCMAVGTLGWIVVHTAAHFGALVAAAEASSGAQERATALVKD